MHEITNRLRYLKRKVTCPEGTLLRDSLNMLSMPTEYEETVLQQLWRDAETGEEEWVDVETVVEP